MLRHADIWRGIDRLAATHNLSPSGLARKSGLDPTTFNKSKRVARDGKPRWPTTESLAKILSATGAGMNEFVSLMSETPGTSVTQRIPVIGYTQAGQAGYFDDAGYPSGKGWDEVEFPDVGDPHVYALEINGDSMMPVYRDGDVVVVSPQAQIRRNDRVVLKTVEGEVMAKVLSRRSAKKIDLHSLNTDFPDRSLDSDDVLWIARIIWASQ